MRFSASSAANAVAWAVIFLLILAAMVLTYRLGFMGLLLLGSATCLVCMTAELDRNAPTWGVEVFKAQLTKPSSPEQRAAMLEGDRLLLSPIRFYRWCELVLMVAGGLGFVVQHWAPNSSLSP